MAVIPNSNVNLATNIRDVLNAAGGSVTNEVITFFKPEAKINKWSKKKPVSYAQVTPLTDDQFKWVNYGLDISYTNPKTPQTVMVDAANGKDFYPYIMPSGGENSPYRLSDFAGYNTNALPPYSISVSPNISVNQFPAVIHFQINLNNSEFKLTDFQSFFTGGYFAVLFSTSLASNAQVLMYKPANPNQYNNMLYCEIPVSKAGTYHLTAIYAQFPASTETTDVSSMAENFMPLPNGYAKVVVAQNVVYAYLTISGLVNGNLYYERENMTVNGFGMAYFTTYFPNGSVPSCSYRFGFTVAMTSDWGQYNHDWYYYDQTIDHENGNTPHTTIFDNFPGQISLSDLLGENFDNSINIYTIRLTPILQRVSGQGYLGFENSINYDVSI